MSITVSNIREAMFKSLIRRCIKESVFLLQDYEDIISARNFFQTIIVSCDMQYICHDIYLVKLCYSILSLLGTLPRSPSCRSHSC
jgi:hypothetical protein